MNEDERRASIGPDDWPLEEGSAEMQDGLRRDTGGSQSTPLEESTDSTSDARDGDEDGDRGALGTATPASKGTEQGPR
jgi:hypothetical protein